MKIINDSDNYYVQLSGCFSETNIKERKICIFPSNQKTRCTAMLHGQMCAACRMDDDLLGMCGSGPSRAHLFLIDCGNVDSALNDPRAHVCLSFDKTQQQKEDVEWKTTQRLTLSRNLQRDDDAFSDPVFWFFFIFFVFLRFFCWLMRQEQREQQERMWEEQNAAATNTIMMTAPSSRATVLDTSGREVLNTSNRRSDGSSNHSTDNIFSFYDPIENNPTAQQLVQICQDQDWKRLRTFFHNIHQQEQQSSENYILQQEFYIRIAVNQIQKTWPNDLQNDNTFSTMLDQWVKEEPNNIHCRIIRINAFIKWAWHARSSAIAQLVSQEQFIQFEKRLKMAESETEYALKLNHSTDHLQHNDDDSNNQPNHNRNRNNHPLIYAHQILLARGLKKPKEYVESCLDSIKSSVDPFNYFAHVQALQYYCRKWMGSHEEMFEFARTVVRGLPRNYGENPNPLWVLIPMAHWGRCIAIQGGRQAREWYWKQPWVRQEILNAYKKAFGEYEKCLNPNNITGWDREMEWTVRNWFAFVLNNCGLKEECCDQIRIIGARPSCRPWPSVSSYETLVMQLGFVISADQEPENEANDYETIHFAEAVPIMASSSDYAMAEARIIV